MIVWISGLHCNFVFVLGPQRKEADHSMGQISSQTADFNSHSARGGRAGHSRSTWRTPTPSTTRRSSSQQFLQLAAPRPTWTQFFHATPGYGNATRASPTRDDAPRSSYSLPVTGSLENGGHAASRRTPITFFVFFKCPQVTNSEYLFVQIIMLFCSP